MTVCTYYHLDRTTHFPRKMA